MGQQLGDPRAPKVDPVDWVERSPLADTRTYVQRVMENLAVYRVRLDTPAPAMTQSEPPRDMRHEANAAMNSPVPYRTACSQSRKIFAS